MGLGAGVPYGPMYGLVRHVAWSLRVLGGYGFGALATPAHTIAMTLQLSMFAVVGPSILKMTFPITKGSCNHWFLITLFKGVSFSHRFPC